MTDTQTLYDRRLGRYQADIACKPVDKVPLAAGSTSFAEADAGADLWAPTAMDTVTCANKIHGV